ncbi:MAG: hypothetical protein HFG99_01510 [Dorea sp.]|nr:hypothetical protein [Dorea sp.]MCI9247823.1 hypothetical protein [Dorea sp.]
MPNIPDILKIIEDGAFTPEEQLTLVKYIDSRLERMELLLYRLERLARQALDSRTMDSEKLRLQGEVQKIETEIDRLSEQLPRIFVTPSED